MSRFTLSVLFCCFPLLCWGQYTNPKLKVLLFNTSSPFTISSVSGLNIRPFAKLRGAKRIKVTPLKRGRLKVNGQGWSRGPIVIHSKSDLWVRRPGFRTRKYAGSLILIPHKTGLYLVNRLRTETYLEGVLGAEINLNWPMAAIKAQAVIARTYALYRHFERQHSQWHLKASTGDQVYLGMEVSGPRAKFAISGTRGVVVSYQGRLAKTFYHANCGGMTEDPGMVWNYSLPYYPVIEVPYGLDDPNFQWEVHLSRSQLTALARKLGLKRQRYRSLQVSQRTSSGRAHRLQLVGNSTVTFPANKFRKVVGYTKVKSLMFEVTPVQDGVLITGQGSGHGVGLCQWGAKDMADQGYSFQEILHFFYRPIDLGYYKG